MIPRSSPVLVIASSARMLAKLLVDNGYQIIAIDLYGDLDTRHYSQAYFCVDQLEGPTFHSLLLQVREQYSVMQVFYGSGFEYYDNSLKFLQQHFEVIGNSSEIISKLSDKPEFFNALKRLNLPYPKVCFGRLPTLSAGLYKPYNSVGGMGIVMDSDDNTSQLPFYWQEYIEGVPCSVLFVATGVDFKIIGFNRQLIQHMDDQPFVFSGIIAQIDLPLEIQNKISECLKSLIVRYALKGLCTLDFMLAHEEIYLLEINARISASAQLYGSQVMQWHIQACVEQVLPEPIRLSSKQAFQILFSEKDCRIPANVNWPEWVVDRPPEGRWISKNQPICSIIINYESLDRVVSDLQHCSHIVKNHLLSGL